MSSSAAHNEWVHHKTKEEEERELIEDLILQNKTLDALIKGLSGDIEIFKNDKEGRWTPTDIVRFTMQLNVMRTKKDRNLREINELVKSHSAPKE